MVRRRLERAKLSQSGLRSEQLVVVRGGGEGEVDHLVDVHGLHLQHQIIHWSTQYLWLAELKMIKYYN